MARKAWAGLSGHPQHHLSQSSDFSCTEGEAAALVLAKGIACCAPRRPAHPLLLTSGLLLHLHLCCFSGLKTHQLQS